MWSPADNLLWQKNSLCSQPENIDSIDWFFSSDFSKKYAAKNLCHECPVRRECLQWALEHREIWGIWGGKDEVEIRRALSVSYSGEELRRRRPPNCPYCSARPSKLRADTAHLPGGGRWTTAKIVICTECGFSWRSRTSYNAVTAYHNDRADKQDRARRARADKSRSRKTLD